MMVNRNWLYLLLAGAVSTVGCGDATTPSAPVVRFQMVSQTCGGPISFVFSIDGARVGEQSLIDHEISRSFESTPGEHLVRAAITNGSFVRDTTVILRGGDVYTHILSPYCS